jgi:hypothetical protein
MDPNFLNRARFEVSTENRCAKIIYGDGYTDLDDGNGDL